MRLLNLFDGIGGFALAAEWMGWQNVGSCEIDPFCRRVLDYHFNYAYIYMTKLNKPISRPLKGKSTSSQGDFLASLFPVQASDEERTITAISGRRCLEQYARFPRVGSWQRMFADCLVSKREWYSSRCVLTWKIQGTKYNRLLFLLVPSMRRTAATECGLLPTVQTHGLKENVDGQTKFFPLSMLPSPKSCDSKGGCATDVQRDENNRYYRTTKDGTKWGANLRDVASTGLLPTPNAMDCKDGTPKTTENWPRHTALKHNIAQRIGQASQLNPRFVAEMMGFPIQHTETPFQTKIQWIELN